MHLASFCEITNYRVINQSFLEKMHILPTSVTVACLLRLMVQDKNGPHDHPSHPDHQPDAANDKYAGNDGEENELNPDNSRRLQ